MNQEEKEQAKFQIAKAGMEGCGGCAMMIAGIVGLIVAFLLWILLSAAFK